MLGKFGEWFGGSKKEVDQSVKTVRIADETTQELHPSDASLRDERFKKTPEAGAFPYVSLSDLLKQITALGNTRFQTYDPAKILAREDPALPKQINELQEEYDETETSRKSGVSTESMKIERYNRLMELKSKARDILERWLEEEKSKKAA